MEGSGPCPKYSIINGNKDRVADTGTAVGKDIVGTGRSELAEPAGLAVDTSSASVVDNKVADNKPGMAVEPDKVEAPGMVEVGIEEPDNNCDCNWNCYFGYNWSDCMRRCSNDGRPVDQKY